MKFEENKVYHIYNRGNNQQKIFFSDENYQFFLRKIKKELEPCCELLKYCLMPNHFHLMVHTNVKNIAENKREKTLNDAVGILLRSYTRAIQKQENIKGSLFQQQTKAKELISARDIAACANYIELNPVKANLVLHANQWKYSSFREYEGSGSANLCNQDLFKRLVIG